MSKFKVNSTAVPNAIIDDVMRHLSGNAFKLYMVIVRKTTGWQKEFDAISISQFMELSGIKRKETALKSVQELLEAGLINAQKEQGKTTVFSLNFEFDQYEKTVPVRKNRTSTNFSTTQYEKTVPVAPETGTKKPYTQKKDIKETNTKEIYKENFLSDDEIVLFEEYLQLRKKMKLSNSVLVVKRLVKKYIEFGRNTEVIEKAITSGWKDFYTLNNKQTGQYKTAQQIRDEKNQAFLERSRRECEAIRRGERHAISG